MKIKLFILTSAFFGSTISFAQDSLWLKQTSISEVLKFEKELKRKPKFLQQSVGMSSDYYPLANKYKVTNPIIVQRKPVGYLPLYAEYFYTPEDSILRLITYDWEIDKHANFFDKQKIWQRESTKLDVYYKEYERIKTLIISKLGTPTSSDSTLKTEASDRGNYFIIESAWETVEIHAKLYMIFESMTYTVRFTLYWKK